MIPSINFGFLMCTYLPGIPIILPIYVSFVSKVLEEIPEPAFKSSLIILYVIISPLIFGLLIDAIRHLFEYSSRWLLEKKLKAVEVGEERESLISVWTKKSVFLVHWEQLPRDILKMYKDEFGKFKDVDS